MARSMFRASKGAIAACVVTAIISGTLLAWAAQTNYLGTVFIADPTVPTRQMTVNSNGSINAAITGGLPAIAAYSLLSNNTSSSAAPIANQTMVLGVPGFALTGDVALAQITNTGNVAAEFDIQNTSNGTTASTDFIVNNDQATNTTHYGDFGINSSGFTGSGSLNLAGATYLYAANGDLALGTSTSNAIHFFVNSGATDAATISSSGAFSTTSMALSGCTIGTDVMCVTGTSTLGGAVTNNNGGFVVANAAKAAAYVTYNTADQVTNFEKATLNFSGNFFNIDTSAGGSGVVRKIGFGGQTFVVDAGNSLIQINNAILTGPSTAVLQMGAGDVNSGPVPQTFRTQGTLAGGTSNVAGADFTQIISPGKGNQAGGTWHLQTCAAGSTGTVVDTCADAITATAAKLITLGGQLVVANMTQTSAAQSGTVCWSAAGLTYDATLGCLASLPELKDFHGRIVNAAAALDKITPMWASWKTNTPEWRGGDHEIQPVFNAREVAAVDKRLVSYGPDGKLRGVRYMEMAAYEWAVSKELLAMNRRLQLANDNLERRITMLERHTTKVYLRH